MSKCHFILIGNTFDKQRVNKIYKRCVSSFIVFVTHLHTKRHKITNKTRTDVNM